MERKRFRTIDRRHPLKARGTFLSHFPSMFEARPGSHRSHGTCDFLNDVDELDECANKKLNDSRNPRL